MHIVTMLNISVVKIYIWVSVGNINTVMNDDLSKMYEWLCSNKLSINIGRANCVVSTRKS